MRDHYETKDAMFTNSLFCDFLINNGMRILKDDYTKDIICLEFNYGSRSYEAELTHLNKVARNARNQYRLAKVKHDAILVERSKNKVDKITELLKEAYKNRNQYKRMNTAEIRKLFYNEGVTINYVTTKKDGEENVESIHYKMLYRSTGKAKKGSCMFIRDRLYERAHKFLYMGIEQDPDNPMIVEISAYAPLVSSSIVDRVRINPNNILILKDVDRSYTTNVVSVETDENQHCIARAIEEYRLKNTLFDGQALIDSSLFPSWGNGYILLRQHFFKAAAFCCNIQEFFRDYFGEDYYYATVKDYWGNVHYLKDIELITTDNACKWMKFDVSYQYWCKKVFQNNCMFGIVKTAHESKLGEMQRMSYQMVNSLSEEIMPDVLKASVDYVTDLKTKDEAFLDFLEKNENFSNDYRVLVALCRNNPEFTRSVYFRRRKEYILKAYVTNLKSGHIIQNADNLVIVGSPYAMLLYAATGREESVDDDDTLKQEDGTIQCYTERFDDGEYLASFRSPFNSKNNMGYLHNVLDSRIKKYFNFGTQIIAVNMVGTDFQDRNNGLT